MSLKSDILELKTKVEGSNSTLVSILIEKGISSATTSSTLNENIESVRDIEGGGGGGDIPEPPYFEVEDDEVGFSYLATPQTKNILTFFNISPTTVANATQFKEDDGEWKTYYSGTTTSNQASTLSHDDYKYHVVKFTSSAISSLTSIGFFSVRQNYLPYVHTLKFGANVVSKFSATTWGNSNFVASATTLSNVEINGNFTNLTTCSNMFTGCYNLTNVTFPSNYYSSKITGMSSMFSGCTSLESVDLSWINATNVTSANTLNVFRACENLKSVIMPSNLKNIGNECFGHCRSITAIYFNQSTPPTLNNNSGIFVNVPASGTVYVPTGVDITAWTTALIGTSITGGRQLPNGWTIVETDMPPLLKKNIALSENGFSDYFRPSDTTVTKFNGTFSGNHFIGTAYIEVNFAEKTSTIAIPNVNGRYNYYYDVADFFTDTDGVVWAKIKNNSMFEINDHYCTFYGRTNDDWVYTSIEIKLPVESDYYFYYNDNKLLCPDGVLYSDGDMESYRYHTLAKTGKDIHTIDTWAFMYSPFTCDKFTIDNPNITINEQAFYQCQFRSGFVFEGLPNTIPSQAFEECTFGDFTIPSNVTEIETEAFNGCRINGEFHIPTSVTNMNVRAFNESQIDGRIIYDGTTSQFMNLYPMDMLSDTESFDIYIQGSNVTAHWDSNEHEWIILGVGDEDRAD